MNDQTRYDPIDSTDTRNERNRQARDTYLEDLHWLMRHRQGRRVVWRWLDDAGIWRLSFNTDALLMAFVEGGRNQGLMLLRALLAACPEFYHVMMQENQDEQKQRHERHDASGAG